MQGESSVKVAVMKAPEFSVPSNGFCLTFWYFIAAMDSKTALSATLFSPFGEHLFLDLRLIFWNSVKSTCFGVQVRTTSASGNVMEDRACRGHLRR